MRDALKPVGRSLEALLDCASPEGRSERLSPNAPLGAALYRALDDVMALPNLVALFGREATANPAGEFSRHFAGRIRHVLATPLATDNPWLTQMLLGRFGPVSPYPWLSASVPGRFPNCRFSNSTMQNALESADAGAWDVIHLSNILDWLTPEQSARLLEHTHRALAKGGRIVIRQLNSSLRIPEAGPFIRWLPEDAARLHATDRSFFYRELHVGTKG